MPCLGRKIFSFLKPVSITNLTLFTVNEVSQMLVHKMSFRVSEAHGAKTYGSEGIILLILHAVGCWAWHHTNHRSSTSCLVSFKHISESYTGHDESTHDHTIPGSSCVCSQCHSVRAKRRERDLGVMLLQQHIPGPSCRWSFWKTSMPFAMVLFTLSRDPFDK